VIKVFEDIIAWQKAKHLSVSVYACFDGCKDFGFRDQIQRATVSVMNNIAEGFERQTRKEFRQHLYIAKGSCAEVRSMLHLALELRLIERNMFQELLDNNLETSKLISGLIKSIK
jgi:four helix bundle protein